MRALWQTISQTIRHHFHQLTQLFRPQPWRWVLPVKGSFYYDAELADAAGWLIIGRSLTLRCEPDNPYDTEAVQIFLPLTLSQKPALIGYIPYSHSRALRWLMQQQKTPFQFEATLFNGYRQYQRLHLFIAIRSSLTLWQRIRLSMLKRPSRQVQKPLE